MYFLTTFCGVCLTDCKDVQSIKNKDIDDISIVEKLKYCCFKTAWIDDGLSLFICYKCYVDLKTAYSFKKRCVSNSTILKGYVSRLKHGTGPLPEHEYGELRVEMQKNKVYGLNLVLCERVKVEQGASEDEATPMDGVEEPVQIKLERRASEQPAGVHSDLVSSSCDKCDAEPVDIKQEASSDVNRPICFVAVKQERDAGLCAETGPDLVQDEAQCSSALGPVAAGGEVNLLNIMNDQISHFLTSDEGLVSPAVASTSLRSLLDASTTAHSRVIQSLQRIGPGEAQVQRPGGMRDEADIECLSSNSDTISAVEDDYESSMQDFAPEYSSRGAHANPSVLSRDSGSRRSCEGDNAVDRSMLEATPDAPRAAFTSVICTAAGRPFANVHAPVRGAPPPYPTHSFPLLHDAIRRPVVAHPPFYPGGRTPPGHTYLIIYDDINPPPPYPNTAAPAPPVSHKPRFATHHAMPTDSTNGGCVRTPANRGHCLPANSGAPTNAPNGESENPHLDATTHACPVCQKMFARDRNLRLHLQTHFSVGVRYKCEYCHEWFVELSEFKRHSSTHAGARLFQCSVCAQRFANRSSLTKHLVSHSDGTAHRCALCHEVFQYKCRLESHMARHHNVHPP